MHPWTYRDIYRGLVWTSTLPRQRLPSRAMAEDGKDARPGLHKPYLKSVELAAT